MSLLVKLSKAARSELIEAAAWYESKQPSLGTEFIAEIDRCLALAARQPLIYAVVYKGLRRVTTKRFPYGIYFQPTDRRLLVVAVFHSRRDPAVWQSRG